MWRILICVLFFFGVCSAAASFMSDFDVSVAEQSNFICSSRASCCARARGCLRAMAIAAAGASGPAGGCAFPLCPRGFLLSGSGNCTHFVEFSGLIQAPPYGSFQECRYKPSVNNEMKSTYQNCLWPFWEMHQNCLERSIFCRTGLTLGDGLTGGECEEYISLDSWDSSVEITAAYP